MARQGNQLNKNTLGRRSREREGKARSSGVRKQINIIFLNGKNFLSWRQRHAMIVKQLNPAVGLFGTKVPDFPIPIKGLPMKCESSSI